MPHPSQLFLKTISSVPYYISYSYATLIPVEYEVLIEQVLNVRFNSLHCTSSGFPTLLQTLITAIRTYIILFIQSRFQTAFFVSVYMLGEFRPHLTCMHKQKIGLGTRLIAWPRSRPRWHTRYRNGTAYCIQKLRHFPFKRRLRLQIRIIIDTNQYLHFSKSAKISLYRL